jgi:hypothetical protein
LRATIGAFADPRVALVQARWGHLNRDASLLTRLQAMLLDGHFAVEQRGRAAAGACFNMNGTAGVWRARAIDEAGGWHADTLTEDLDLSYRAALAGWRFVYAPAVLAPAELPADVAAWKAQQFRWAKGSIECARKLAGPALRARWPWRHRVEALFHLTHNLPYLLTLIVLVAGGAVIASGAAPAWAPTVHAISAITTACVLAGFVAVTDGPRLATLARVPALIALTAGMAPSQARAVVLGAIGRVTPFERTPKDGGVGRARAPRRYRAATTSVVAGELALAAYLTACAGIAAAHGATRVSGARGVAGGRRRRGGGGDRARRAGVAALHPGAQSGQTRSINTSTGSASLCMNAAQISGIGGIDAPSGTSISARWKERMTANRPSCTTGPCSSASGTVSACSSRSDSSRSVVIHARTRRPGFIASQTWTSCPRRPACAASYATSARSVAKVSATIPSVSLVRCGMSGIGIKDCISVRRSTPSGGGSRLPPRGWKVFHPDVASTTAGAAASPLALG